MPKQFDANVLNQLANADKVPEHLSTLLSKEQICAFLGLPTKANEPKATLVLQLRALLEADQGAKARFFDMFAQELAVEPWELETLLGCSTTERKRWVADGKLIPLTTRSVFKSGRELVYPVFDRRSIRCLTQEDIEGWRAEHAALVAMRRKKRLFSSVEPSSFSEKKPGKEIQ